LSLYKLLDTNTCYRNKLYQYKENFRLLVKKQNRLKERITLLSHSTNANNAHIIETLTVNKKELNLFDFLLTHHIKVKKQSWLNVFSKLFKGDNLNILDKDKKELLNKVFIRNGREPIDADLTNKLKETLEKFYKKQKQLAGIDFTKDGDKDIYTYGTMKVNVCLDNNILKSNP
jgi:hypothetical protein